MKNTRNCSRSSADKVQTRSQSPVWRDTVTERECLELNQEIEHSSEKQEVLATLMEGKMSMQKVAPEQYQENIFEELKELEEQKTKEALELLGRKMR